MHDAVIMGVPTRIAAFLAQWKDFWDSSSGLTLAYYCVLSKGAFLVDALPSLINSSTFLLFLNSRLPIHPCARKPFLLTHFSISLPIQFFSHTVAAIDPL
ncbi:hypothetical protein C8J57DRAFT_1528147 [Mycena rebaudengoi]|nr:hypothetical protein C8J57DRAFT_1528147 [Mycena rebaudengoi]